ncbi:hypothetical protein QYE76_020998 [Lolium multiflorum]|uniref:Uncharacterized protein n=1 Tax=Lolium multiflorum TaxID=4521 RepID=A0AAD8R727_LOLMU|nr:hypothetical protein QYE76_020998 [Lolium multiflorum]
MHTATTAAGSVSYEAIMEGGAGCLDSNILAGFDRAIADGVDGVDVISISISNGFPSKIVLGDGWRMSGVSLYYIDLSLVAAKIDICDCGSSPRVSKGMVVKEAGGAEHGGRAPPRVFLGAARRSVERRGRGQGRRIHGPWWWARCAQALPLREKKKSSRTN